MVFELALLVEEEDEASSESGQLNGRRQLQVNNYSKINDGVVYVEDRPFPALKVELVPFDVDDECAESLGLNWQCVDYNEDELLL